MEIIIVAYLHIFEKKSGADFLTEMLQLENVINLSILTLEFSALNMGN